MKIALLNIGTELLRGRTVNTNAAYMGEALLNAGYAVDATLVIHDDGPVITAAMVGLLDDHDVVLVTGGLGPTKDDITKKVLLELFGGEMVCHEPTLHRIEGFLKRLERPLLEHNRQQAFVPSSCEVLENEMGTAPGMAFRRGGKALISMPGVPFEMKWLLRERVIPWLQARYPVARQISKVVRTAGIPESRMAEKMEAIEDQLDPHIAIAYLPSYDGTKIELKLQGQPEEEEVLNAILLSAQAQVAALFSQYVYSLEDKQPDQLLAEWLIANHRSFATAESCTGGEIAAKLVKHSGISAVFKGGVVAYMPEVKVAMLGVSAETISTNGIVSAEVAREMADGVRNALGADFAISITGIAEAAKDAPADQQPQAWIGFAGPNGTQTLHIRLMKDRKVNIEIAAYAALVFALRVIQAS
ncbi:MAG: CinA family nicotinamide mononucleotide deamidase-related protein [Bacteroidetes bacterium]|nr:CinA family nicotinamide mononucleotide deamidase-related protein [Bacteroidota bacterium]